MLPVHFISTYANFSEKKALLQMLQAGVTYIADRGYVSFPLFYQITKNQAFYIIRTKANVKYTCQEILRVCIPPQWQPFVSQVTDSKIICDYLAISRMPCMADALQDRQRPGRPLSSVQGCIYSVSCKASAIPI